MGSNFVCNLTVVDDTFDIKGLYPFYIECVVQLEQIEVTGIN